MPIRGGGGISSVSSDQGKVTLSVGCVCDQPVPMVANMQCLSQISMDALCCGTAA
jgi:hypothetical protein